MTPEAEHPEAEQARRWLVRAAQELRNADRIPLMVIWRHDIEIEGKKRWGVVVPDEIEPKEAMQIIAMAGEVVLALHRQDPGVNQNVVAADSPEGHKCERCGRTWPEPFGAQCPGCDIDDAFVRHEGGR